MSQYTLRCDLLKQVGYVSSCRHLKSFQLNIIRMNKQINKQAAEPENISSYCLGCVRYMLQIIPNLWPSGRKNYVYYRPRGARVVYRVKSKVRLYYSAL